jgi:hypothetical protein
MSLAQEKNEIQRFDEQHEPLETPKPGQIINIENFQVLGLDQEDAQFYTNFSEKKRKRVIRKVDVRLVPVLAVLYLISHIDRGNIGVRQTMANLFERD